MIILVTNSWANTSSITISFNLSANSASYATDAANRATDSNNQYQRLPNALIYDAPITYPATQNDAINKCNDDVNAAQADVTAIQNMGATGSSDYTSANSSLNTCKDNYNKCVNYIFP